MFKKLQLKLINSFIVKKFLSRYYHLPPDAELLMLTKTGYAFWKDKKANLAIYREFSTPLLKIGLCKRAKTVILKAFKNYVYSFYQRWKKIYRR